MLQGLEAASNILHTALDQYLDACSAIPSSFTQENQFKGVLQEAPDRLTNELSRIASYQERLNRAKVAIGRSRNGCTSIVPIGTLPSEILARIFHLVLDTQSCVVGKEVYQERTLFPKYPDWLSHVCSRWRHVIIGSRALWSHIDLAPYNSLHNGLLARAAVCATRAGHLPLYIHVMSFGYQSRYYDPIRDSLKQFLASVATRIKSLELVAGDTMTVEQPTRVIHILETCIESCIPGTLTRLVITNTSTTIPTFLGTEEVTPAGQDFPRTMLLGLSHEFLEDLWRHITDLQLYGLYPYWTSEAYHGLVELRLATHFIPELPISEWELTNILKSSPKLRLFQLGFAIDDPSPADARVTPVRLEDLEDLSLSRLDHDQLRLLLRWFAPGSKPLQLSLAELYDVDLSSLGDEINQFFTRSNITKLRLTEIVVTHLVITEFLELLPYLQVLVLEESNWDRETQLGAYEPRPEPRDVMVRRFRLDQLCILHCGINFDDFQWFLEKNPVRKLTFGNCVEGDHLMLDNQEARNKLSHLCPIVEFIGTNKQG